MMTIYLRRSLNALTLTATAGLAATVLALPAQAQISNVALFREGVSEQTGASSSSLEGYFLADSVLLTNSGDITSATLTYPGAGSPVSLTNAGSSFIYQTPFYNTQADMDAAFPATGAYTNSWSGGSVGSGSSVINQAGDIFSNTPLFSGSTYAALTGSPGIDATQGFTFNWGSFLANASANENDIFFTITDTATNATVFSEGFLPGATTSTFLAANTLTAGTSYQVNLDFSSRIDTLSNGPETFQAYDESTLLNFQTAPAAVTATPEPAGLLPIAIGLLGLGGLALTAKKRMPIQG